MTRVFLGIPLGPVLEDKIAAWQAAPAGFRVRWIKGGDLHVTLFPPWSEEDVAAVIERLRGLVPPSTFSANFRGISFGPNTRLPRLIWAYGPPPPELFDLRDALERTLGVEVDARWDFALHVTLARFHPEDLRAFPVQHLEETIDWSLRVDQIALYSSKPSAEGSGYRILHRIRLA